MGRCLVETVKARSNLHAYKPSANFVPWPDFQLRLKSKIKKLKITFSWQGFGSQKSRIKFILYSSSGHKENEIEITSGSAPSMSVHHDQN